MGRSRPGGKQSQRHVDLLGDDSGVNVAEILGDEVLFVLVDGQEIDPGVYLAAIVAHLAVAAVLAAGWLVVGAFGPARPARRSSVRTRPVGDESAEPLRAPGPGVR